MNAAVVDSATAIFVVPTSKKGDGFIGNELTIYNSEYIMTTPLEKQEYIIYKMMYPGLYILAGAPKKGKSWLALDLCMSVANGEQFLKHDTNTGQVLYLSLEDNLLRLQNRIYELTDEPCENQLRNRSEIYWQRSGRRT